MREQLALVCEGEHDRIIAETLVERVLREDIEWYAGNENHLREWRRKNGGAALYWKEIRRRFRLHGGRRRLQDAHAHGDAAAAEKAVHIIAFDYSRKAHALLIRDCDGQPERFEALTSVREKYAGRSILIGFAVDRIEAWVLAAFQPDDEHESAALDNEKKRIGFDPTERPHKLTASSKNAKKNPKRVLETLLHQRGANRQAYAEIVDTVQWERLQKDGRGNRCGLLPFRREIRDRLAPCFSEKGRLTRLP